MIKIFTQEEYDAIEQDEHGVKHLATGDYSQVVIKNDRCFADAWCLFSAECKFGAGCKFGALCEFGTECKFGVGCKFGNGCKLDEWCSFGDGCKFGDKCKFGDGCKFGVDFSFEEFFFHGKNTTFEGGAVKNGTFLKISRIGSEMRDAYFFVDEDGKFFVRTGDWFNDMGNFIKQVRMLHKGTRYERQYLAACEYAKAVLPEMLDKINER